ncbi:MAG TPA: lipoyl(octanoyl) transferase LipB [Candidatus Acidoferrales bacterium]|nr:lipoyl(octanoyl) transferase LipB [Candidatus Acidoferrales bacterium]
MRALLLHDLGVADYGHVLELQERLVEMRQRGDVSDLVLLVEHPHVFTIGRGGNERHLLDQGDIPLFRVTRGGDITYHGPGQMVAYPIIDLRSHLRKAVHRYLRELEESTIATLSDFGMSARRMPPWTGLWIENRKIASIGIRVRKGVTFHGLALNVSTDLAYFERIVPCGLSWAEMTSMEKELGRRVPFSDVKERWARAFAERLGYSELKPLCQEGIPIGLKSDSRVAPTTSG